MARAPPGGSPPPGPRPASPRPLARPRPVEASPARYPAASPLREPGPAPWLRRPRGPLLGASAGRVRSRPGPWPPRGRGTCSFSLTWQQKQLVYPHKFLMMNRDKKEKMFVL